MAQDGEKQEKWRGRKVEGKRERGRKINETEEGLR